MALSSVSLTLPVATVFLAIGSLLIPRTRYDRRDYLFPAFLIQGRLAFEMALSTRLSYES